jgi:formate dehydrogenase iron-sulfur subunit
MTKRVLIDMLKLRSLDTCKAEAFDRGIIGNRTFKSVREIASFYFTCRRCDEAPCINVCPPNALEKDKSGWRSNTLAELMHKM